MRRRCVTWAVLGCILTYAVLAGLRTITDPDTGWQLASGRYLVEHHQLPSTDVLSYTAHGHAWIYPPLSELFLYVLYLVGGFAALSWLNATACAMTVAIALAAEYNVAAAILSILAIPAIAYRTAPRADLFTTVFFAVLLSILWRHYRGRSAPLWLIPITMLLWVNSHLGFVAGVALLAGYAGLEFSEFIFAARRSAARMRLRRAAPWLLTSLLVTPFNPWGTKIYTAVFEQQRELKLHETVIAEWRHIPLSAETLSQVFNWRNPNSSYLWLLGAAGFAILIAARRKEFGSAILLFGFAYLSTSNLRFQALFALVAIVQGAFVFRSSFIRPASSEARKTKRRQLRMEPQWPAGAAACVIIAIGFVLVFVRDYDLITQRAYIRAGEVTLFGVGLSSWYPEHAAQSILKDHLPGNIFHEYNMGGYLAFRLGPKYPDYIDGRALPFGDLILHQRKLMKQSPDSSAWQQEADQRGINTLIFSVARYWGLGSTHVAQFCNSQAWKPVYLDETGAVFVRNTPANADVIKRSQINCATITFAPSTSLVTDPSYRGRAELFNFYANVGAILYKLSRNAEAASALDRALEMFPEEPYLHHTRGQVYEASGQLLDAEREYKISARLNPTEANWYSLALLYYSEHRYRDAIHAAEQAARLSARPSEYYLFLGMLYLNTNKPIDALEAFDVTEANSDYEPPDARLEIEASVAEGRAQAWASLGDLNRAVAFQQQALNLAPANPKLWATLADLYAAEGRFSLEHDARQHAQALSQQTVAR